jgi:hypothetical protein
MLALPQHLAESFNFVRSVRRFDSVGCAVNTSSIASRSTSACISTAGTPRRFSSTTAASMLSRSGAAWAPA